MHGFKYVTNTLTWEIYWLQSSSVHSNNEDQEVPWLQNLWYKDAAASTKERWTRANLSLAAIWVNNHFASSCITFDAR